MCQLSVVARHKTTKPQTKGCKNEPGPAVRHLHKTQHGLGLQLDQLVAMQLDALDPAAQLSNNTRHMLSRLGVGVGGDDDNASTMPRHPNGGDTEGTAYSKWHLHQHQHHQQGRRELDEEQRDAGLNKYEDFESVVEDEKAYGSCCCGFGGINFQEELARAFKVAVRGDKRLKRKMTGIVSRAFKESRQEQVIKGLLVVLCLLTTPSALLSRWRALSVKYLRPIAIMGGYLARSHPVHSYIQQYPLNAKLRCWISLHIMRACAWPTTDTRRVSQAHSQDVPSEAIVLYLAARRAFWGILSYARFRNESRIQKGGQLPFYPRCLSVESAKQPSTERGEAQCFKSITSIACA